MLYIICGILAIVLSFILIICCNKKITKLEEDYSNKLKVKESSYQYMCKRYDNLNELSLKMEKINKEKLKTKNDEICQLKETIDLLIDKSRTIR